MHNQTAKIKQINAREILNSRGNPTVEVKLILDNGLQTKASVPSGASKGEHEAVELRDNDSSRYGSKGVLKACYNVDKVIAPAIIGRAPDPKVIDKIMIKLDGTKNKSKLGANAILCVSLAVARAAALVSGVPLYKYIRKEYGLTSKKYNLPIPMFNVINGGKHSDSGLSIQEFMVIPVDKESFKKKVRIGVEVFIALKQALKIRGFRFAVGDEGGFAPKIKTTKKVFDLLTTITKSIESHLSTEIFLGIDAAASVFYNKETGKYLFEKKNLSGENMLKLYWEWLKNYHLLLIEDPFYENDWEMWPKLTEKIKTLDSRLVVGDDLFTTNVERLQKGIELKACNSILIKLNQIGTLTQTIDCINLAKKNNYKVIISHRSGETNDDFIADLAVGVNADFIKAGAPDRGERVAKYNRLMEIEDELGLIALKK